MGLEITTKRDQEEAMTTGTYIVKERLYKTAEGEVVPEGHADAAFLFAAAGDEIPLAEAEKAGLCEVTTEVKEKTPAANKKRKPAANKKAEADAADDGDEE